MSDAAETTRARELARDMLLGQHSVTAAAVHSGLPHARVKAMADALHQARRIPRVRA